MGLGTPIEFLLVVLGTSSIGTWWFGTIGGILGFILGSFLFIVLQKKNSKNIK
jgi:hypothetical protein